MEIPPLQRHIDVDHLPIEKLAGNSHLSESEKVGEVSKQFEAILLRNILGEAQKTLFRSSANPDSASTGVYQDMITNQLAENISRSGSFGLAHSLEKQLRHELKTDPPDRDASRKI